MLKLLVITPLLSGGGAEKMLIEYSLLAQESAMDVTLVNTSRCNAFNSSEYPFKVHCLNKEKVVLSFFSLAKYILFSKPDVIFISHLRISFLVTILKILRIHRGKIIVRSENLLNEEIKYKCVPRYYIFIRKFSYFFSDYIISQTDKMSKEISDSIQLSKKKITVLYNFPSINLVNFQQNTKANNLNITTLVYVGRLSKQKNIDLILDAAAYIKRKNKIININILGRGPEEERLKLKARQLGLENSVTFLGYKNNSREYIENSQALLLSSYYEGLPNVMLEALSYGVPVVTTRCFGNEDRYIITGKTGYICESFNIEDYAKLMLLAVANKQRGPWEEITTLLLNDRKKAKYFLETIS